MYFTRANALVSLLAIVVFGLGVASLQPAWAQQAVVYLDSSDEWESVGRQKRYGGLLTRELCRQAFLIAAREELGCVTRDSWVGDAAPKSDAAPIFDLVFDPQKALTIHIVRRQGDNVSELGDFAPGLTLEAYLDDIARAAEKASHTTFVEVLKKADISGKAKPWNDSGPLPPQVEPLLAEMSVIAQYDAIRRTHHQIRAAGESPELLGALVRGYSNLGILTEDYWHPAHKAFQARALLYAERLARRAPKWALTPWHRGYANALAGLHMVAIKELRSAQDATEKKARPAWGLLALAHSTFDFKQMDPATTAPECADLARLLRAIDLSLSGSPARFLKNAIADVQEMPECFRILDTICEQGGVGVKAAITGASLNSLATTLYRRMADMSDMPEGPRSLVDDRLQDPDADDELRDRALLMGALSNGDQDGADFVAKDIAKRGDKPLAKTVGEPSWATLGLLLRELSFLQATRRAEFENQSLGVSPDEFLKEAEPSYVGHPYTSYLLGHSWDPRTKRTGLQRMMQVKPKSVEIQSVRMLMATENPQSRRIFTAMVKNHDPVARDLALLIQSSNIAMIKRLSKQLSEVSPSSPLARAMLVRYEWPTVKDHAKDWEHQGDPVVLVTLAEQYQAASDLDSAIRCLNRAKEQSADVSTFRRLATIYQQQGKTDQWKATLESYLELPDYGLEHAHICADLARHHMKLRQFEEALPYAERSAQSFAAFGLNVAADCYEALQRWEDAEKTREACTRRYRDLWFEWYSFCRRTGHGNLDASRKLAADRVAELERDKLTVREDLAMFYLIDGQLQPALTTYQALSRKSNNPWHDMNVLLLAIELGDADARTTALKSMREHAVGYKPSRATLTRLAELIADDAAEKRQAAFDKASMDELLKKCEPYDQLNCLYFLAKYYDLCKRETEAVTLYKETMTGTQLDFLGRTLAGSRLVARNLRPEEFLTKELGIRDDESRTDGNQKMPK